MENVSEKTLDLINQGAALMSQEKYEEALEKFKAASDDSPKYFDCYINLGNVYSCLEKYDDALVEFKKALMLNEKSAEALFDIGNVMFLQDDIKGAIEYYNKAEETGEITSEMCDIIADLFRNQGDDIQALRFINKGLSIDPLNGGLYLEKARIFVDAGKTEEAIETLDEMNKLLPDAYEAYDLLSQIYTIQKDYKNAMNIIEKGTSRFPEDPNLAYLKLKVYSDFKMDKEINEYVKWMRDNNLYNDRKIDVSLLVTEMYLRQDNIEEAINTLENAADGDYSNSQLATELCTMYLKKENFDKVISITEQMITQDNGMFFEATGKFYHAQALMLSGKTEESEAEFKTITKEFRRMTIAEPSFYEGYMYRLLSHRALKEYDEAESLAEYMINLFPERPDGHVFKYMIYKDQGDETNAELEKKQIEELDPDFVL